MDDGGVEGENAQDRQTAHRLLTRDQMVRMAIKLAIHFAVKLRELTLPFLPLVGKRLVSVLCLVYITKPAVVQ